MHFFFIFSYFVFWGILLVFFPPDRPEAISFYLPVTFHHWLLLLLLLPAIFRSA
jgi:hypothetical protein